MDTLSEQIKKAKHVQEQKIAKLQEAGHQTDIINLTQQIQSKALLIKELENLKSAMEYND